MESFQKILAQVFEVLKPIARFILNLPLIVQILGGIVLFILLLITIFRFTYSGKIASAVNKNKGEKLSRLLSGVKKPEKVQKYTNRALDDACTYNKPDMAEIAIQYGADINPSEPDYTRPLHSAAMMNNTDMVSMLLKRGAHVDSKDYAKTTPLFAAIQYSSLESAEILLNHKADINSRNTNDEITPLHSAVLTLKMNLVKWLVEHGADTRATVQHGIYAGKSPIELAKSLSAKDIIEYIQQHGY